MIPILRPPPWAMTRRVWRVHPGYIMAWGLNVLAAFYFGVTAIVCDPVRFESPTWDGLRGSLGVPGFGWLLVAFGALLLIGVWLPARAMLLVFWFGGLVYLTVAYVFLAGVVGSPYAAPWGPGFGLLIGLWQVSQAEAYRQSVRGVA